MEEAAAAGLQELHRLGFLLDLNHSSNLTVPQSIGEASLAATPRERPHREHADYHLSLALSHCHSEIALTNSTTHPPVEIMAALKEAISASVLSPSPSLFQT